MGYTDLSNSIFFFFLKKMRKLIHSFEPKRNLNINNDLFSVCKDPMAVKILVILGEKIDANDNDGGASFSFAKQNVFTTR